MKALLRVIQYLRPYQALALLTFVFAAGAAALDLLPPWLVKVVIDEVIAAERTEMLPLVIAGLVGAYALKALCASLRIRFNNTLEQRVVRDLRDQVFSALQRMSVRYYENRSTGEIMSRVVSDTEHVERIFVDGIETLLTSSLTLIGITVVLFVLNWKMAVLALVPIPVLVVSATVFTKRVHGYYHSLRQSAGELNGYLQDALSGIRETMGYNRHDHERARFVRLSQAYSEQNLKAMFLWSVYSPTMMFLGSLGTILIVAYGAGEVQAQRLTLGELVMFLSYLALFYVPINQIHSVNHLLQHALAASERVFDILDTIPDVADRVGVVAPRGRIEGEVVWADVSFAYRADFPVIHHVDLTVKAGERIAFVGPSGAGKSTLLKLLMRFYDVSAGAITIDGYDVREVPLAFLRGQIGYVQQEPFLFNGTVRENLLYGDLTASQERVEQAARIARAYTFIQELPEGYETQLGERGVKLSVGQKQRLSIARVLLKDPPIVIFDEATSNIDTETEGHIREALNELTVGRTTCIIAHRLSTLQQVDRIVVVDGGRVVEQGTHEHLLRQRGLYTILYEAQFQE